jgi:hypothetical protein
MSHPQACSAAMAATVAGLLAWQLTASWRHQPPPDESTRRRRYKLGWEVRGMVLAVSVPFAVGILFGRVSHDYMFALVLFQVAGLLAADLIAPSGLAHAVGERLHARQWHSRRR